MNIVGSRCCMTIQDDMIGKHPEEGPFSLWLQCNDIEDTPTKKHRALSEKIEFREDFSKEIARWLVKHHLSDRAKHNLKRQKEILQKYEFENFAESLNILPTSDKTRKGNFGEVLLIEYLSKTSNIDILVFKLHFNSNIDQSMKGDDVLLVNQNKIIVGESKFRKSPSKQAIIEACSSMNTNLVLPISLGFIADRLFENKKFEWVDMIEEIQKNLGKNKFDIKNVGFLMSSEKVKEHANKHLESANEDFLFISLGTNNPETLIESGFEEAQEILKRGEV